MTVSHILGSKSRDVITVRPDDNVAKVVSLLAEKKIGAVVVTDDKQHIKGIVSERDVVRHLASDGAALMKKSVEAIMTKNVRSCGEGDSEQELMALMTNFRIRHLPVVVAGKLVGMISIGDVVKHRMQAIEQDVDAMKAYIAGAA